MPLRSSLTTVLLTGAVSAAVLGSVPFVAVGLGVAFVVEVVLGLAPPNGE